MHRATPTNARAEHFRAKDRQTTIEVAERRECEGGRGKKLTERWCDRKMTNREAYESEERLVPGTVFFIAHVFLSPHFSVIVVRRAPAV
jgi:hypothetical protein